MFICCAASFMFSFGFLVSEGLYLSALFLSVPVSRHPLTTCVLVFLYDSILHSHIIIRCLFYTRHFLLFPLCLTVISVLSCPTTLNCVLAFCSASFVFAYVSILL